MRIRCGYCGSSRHTIDWCPKTHHGSARNAWPSLHHLRCSYCGSKFHNRDACPKAWPGPDPQVRERT